MNKFLKVLILLLVIVILAAGAGLFLGYKISTGDTIVSNVYVGDISVGKMTREQAVSVLAANGWKDRAETPLTVTTVGGQSFEVDPVRANTTLAPEAAAEAAFTVAHDGNLVENLISFVRLIMDPVDVNQLNTAPDEAYIDSCIEEGIEKVNNYMGEREYTADCDTGELTLYKGWGQIGFDKADLRNEIIKVLDQGGSSLSYTKLSSELKSPDFNGIFSDIKSECANARYSDDGRFDVIEETLGCSFDVSQAQKLWEAAAPGEEVVIPLDVKRPDITGEYLKSRLYCDLLGATTTKFPASAEARRGNLRLALEKIDGYILYPGDEFSYNDVVGERTEEAGFQPAPAYVNGDTKDEIGGGVCQVASTLYASTLFAFLETVERECHYYRPTYMQMGTDATVTIPAEGRAINFRFRNSRNYPIMIKTDFNNDESYMTVEIWGTLEDWDYMPVCFDNSYTYEFDYCRYIDKADENRTGYTIKLEHETYSFSDDVGPGYRTLTHRLVIDPDGNTVIDEIVNPLRSNSQTDRAMDTYYVHQ